MTKKILILFLLLLTILLFFSCPEEMVVGSIWSGKIYNYNNKDGKDKFKAVFYGDNLVKFYFDSDNNPIATAVFKGEYKIENNHITSNMEATFKDKPGDDIEDDFYLEIDGNIDLFKGEATGRAYLKEKISDSGTYHLTGELIMNKVSD